MTPTLSEASALIVIVPATVEPDAGDVMATVGGVQSAPSLDTVIVTALEVVTLPAASRARAVKKWKPLAAVAVSQETEYGTLASSAPRLAPSTLNWTLTTPTLSEASAVTAMVPETVDPDAGDVMLTVGGVVSLKTVTVTALEVASFPAASRARAVNVWEPLP